MELIFFRFQRQNRLDEEKNADYYTRVCVYLSWFIFSFIKLQTKNEWFCFGIVRFYSVKLARWPWQNIIKRHRMNEEGKKNLPNVYYNAQPINYHSSYTSQFNEKNIWARLGSLFSVRRSINMWMSIDVLKRLSKGDTFRFA